MEKREDRELRTVTTLQAPIEIVWKVWTDPEHIVQWWGPKGFTSTIETMDFRQGGEWRLMLHGPDGTNYPNRSIFTEIVPFKKIVFEHFNPHFIATIEFDSNGEETEIDWSSQFDSVEMREIIVKAHKADEGQKQNIEKLKSYLATLRD